MSNLSKLKKKAAEFEQKRQFDRALEAYEEVLQAQDGGEDGDISLYNRVGDLQLRLGRMAEALRSYERAVDLYTDRGFLNNAIALCNKILRQDPSRAGVHYKLGRVCAAKGFRSDARQHFVTYAELMQRAGKLDDALTALQEVADLGEAQDDLRLLLAEHLARHDRRDEALAQLHIVLERCEAERRQVEADAIRARIHELDPDYRDEELPSESSHHEPAGSPARPSGPRARTVASEGAMPELVLIEPTDYAAHASPAEARRPPSGWEERVAQPGRASGALLMPEELIRGVDDGLAAAPTTAESDVYTVDDLLPGNGARVAAEEPSAVEAAALAPLDLVLDGPAEPSAETPLVVDDVPEPKLELMRPSGGFSFVLPPSADLLELDADAADDVAGEPAADATPELVELDFALPDAPTESTHPAPAPATGPLALVDDELLAFSLELDGVVAPAESTTTGDAASDDGDELAWIVAPDAVAPEAAAPAAGGWHGRVAAARASLATGDVDGALRMLSGVLAELDAAGELQAADAALDELLELAPDALPLHEQRVARYSQRGLTARVVSANLALAGAARAAGQEQLARVAYARVLEVAPGHAEAAAALAPTHRELPRVVRPVVPTPAAPTRAVMPTPMAVRPVPSTPIGTRAVEPPAAVVAGAGDFVNLGDLLREEGLPRSTRMVVEERAPTGDEEADFVAMLSKFKQGVAENVDDEDYDSHYDLGVAYKEMGLVDEAIAAFQRALRGTTRKARTYEALGQCFLERGQYAVAAAVLQRATQEPGLDDQQLVGVLYLLGRAAESTNQRSEALRYYERVLAVDITFSDVADRIGAVEQVAR